MGLFVIGAGFSSPFFSMATTGVSAFQMFKNKVDQRQKQKKENVVSFIKAENEKKKKRREDKKQKDEEAKEGKKKNRRRKRKTKEERAVQREEQLTNTVDKGIQRANINNANTKNNNNNNKNNNTTTTSDPKKRSLALQKEDVEKLKAMGAPSSGAFVAHAKKKMENKAGGKRKREEADEDEEDVEAHQSRAKSQMELIFGKSAGA